MRKFKIIVKRFFAAKKLVDMLAETEAQNKALQAKTNEQAKALEHMKVAHDQRVQALQVNCANTVRRNRQLSLELDFAQTKINELNAKLDAHEARQQNTIYRDIDKLINAQTVKGLQKYGKAVQADNLTSIEWLNHALEESADKMVYLTALKQTLMKEVQQ